MLQSTLARVEAELETVKHDLQKAEMAMDRANTKEKFHNQELQKLEQELDAWKDKYHQSEQVYWLTVLHTEVMREKVK